MLTVHALALFAAARLAVIAVLFWMVATGCAESSPAAAPAGRYPMSGRPLAGMDAFDRQFVELMQQWAIPGAAVAVAKQGRLVYARGYGWQDMENLQAMEPDTLFRIASVSKAVTAVAVLKLVEQGKLALDARAFELLKDVKPCMCGSAGVDPRLYQITVRDLLQMTAGWNRAESGDPMFAPLVHYASHYCSPTLRADSLSIVRYWMGKPLDFTPGTSYAYSNLCYAVLEQLIARTSGRPYSRFVKDEVLKPIGITDMRLGRTLSRAEHEAVYYPFPGQEMANSYFPNVKGLVPLAYGGDFALEALAAPAGWIASPVDLVRFVATLAGERKVPGPISRKSVQVMLSRPAVAYWKGKKQYFAMGWEVMVTGGGLVYSRTGSLPGSMAYVVHTAGDQAWAFAANSRPRDQVGFLNDVRALVSHAIARQKSWPADDLFDRFR